MSDNNAGGKEVASSSMDASSEVKPDDSDNVTTAQSATVPGTQSTSEMLMGLMQKSLGLAEKQEQVLTSLNLKGVADFIASTKCKNVVTMAGAGISTSAGIPDFRSPGTGLYDNLKKYDLPNPQAIFDIEFFKKNPKPFFELAKELWPGIFKPTWCHYFIKLLDNKGCLLRHYSQNIDTLERVAGIDPEKIVEAHGTFHTAHCIECKHKYSQEWIKEKIFADEIPTCNEEDCDSLVKPDIIFFGERMPNRFFECVNKDLAKCDLLIIMGTSLVVQPFASLSNRVPETCPRLYINMEKAIGSADPMMALLGMGHGFRFDQEDNYRDVFWQGTCDDGCQELARLIGWESDFTKMVAQEYREIDARIKAEKHNLSRLKKDTTSSMKPTESTSTKSDKDTKQEDLSAEISKLTLEKGSGDHEHKSVVETNAGDTNNENISGKL